MRWEGRRVPQRGSNPNDVLRSEERRPHGGLAAEVAPRFIERCPRAHDGPVARRNGRVPRPCAPGIAGARTAV